MMKQRSFLTITSGIFAAIAVLHALRIFYGWEAVIGGFAVPMWLSWVAVLAAGYLAYHGYRFSR